MDADERRDLAGRSALRRADRLPPDPRKRDKNAVGGLCRGGVRGVSLLLIQGWWHYMLSAQSDTMIVALVLAAVDSHLSGRPGWHTRWALVAALGRPGGVAVRGLYAIWGWRAVPGCG